MTDAMAAEDLSCAEELLNALRPSNDRWRDSRAWVFRGHADASWRLVPSILRGGTELWQRFLDQSQRSMVNRTHMRDRARTIAEFNAIYRFMLAADRAGLAVPEDSQSIRGYVRLRTALRPPGETAGTGYPPDVAIWPPPGLLSVIGLAQHYGVPTRLLDWSWKPLVAAYFAARDVVFSTKSLPTEQLEVWCLIEQLVDMAGRNDGLMAVVTAPQATNPNLAAQAGLFTLVRDQHEDVSLDRVLTERTACTGALASLARAESPYIRRLSLPHSQASRLLRLLALEGVNAATVFPGYKGVVQSLEEERRWDD